MLLGLSLVSIAFAAWGIFQLWRAKSLGKISVGVVDVDCPTSPIYFWFQVGLNLVGVILFGGGALLFAAQALGLISK